MLVVDVRDALSAERAIQTLLARFGKLDIVVANAGAISPIEHSIKRALLPCTVVLFTFFCFFFSPRQEMHQKDPEAWWNTFEVNVRGVFNFFR